MIKIEQDGVIHLTRGDTARFDVSIVNDASEENYDMSPFDTLTLTVKKAISDDIPKFQKRLRGEHVFHILPEDTKDLPFGRYVYDVQLTLENEDVYTIIEPTTFNLTREVTY